VFYYFKGVCPTSSPPAPWAPYQRLFLWETAWPPTRRVDQGSAVGLDLVRCGSWNSCLREALFCGPAGEMRRIPRKISGDMRWSGRFPPQPKEVIGTLFRLCGGNDLRFIFNTSSLTLFCEEDVPSYAARRRREGGTAEQGSKQASCRSLDCYDCGDAGAAAR
jgi:hypothetical protein